MNFDANAMAMLLSLDDRQLWEKILQIAGASGIRLNQTVPPHEELERLRGLFQGCGQKDLQTALSTIARYRQGGKG